MLVKNAWSLRYLIQFLADLDLFLDPLPPDVIILSTQLVNINVYNIGGCEGRVLKTDSRDNCCRCTMGLAVFNYR